MMTEVVVWIWGELGDVGQGPLSWLFFLYLLESDTE